MIATFTSQVCPRFPLVGALYLVYHFATLTTCHAAEPARIAGRVVSVESQPRFELFWDAVPYAAYRVQVLTNLGGDSSSWQTIDVVTAASGVKGPLKWMAPESLRGDTFYRLAGPDPEIAGVEPAFVDSSDPGAVLYLRGQCLPATALVEINGMLFAAADPDATGTSLSVGLNGLPPGQPIFGNIRVLDGGNSNLITEWTVQSPLIYGREQTAEQLQGPPGIPPASPQALIAAWLTKKGYDYYKAKSDLNAAGLHTNPYFVENTMAGEMPEVKSHALLSRRGYDYYKAASDLNSARGRGHVTVLKAQEDDEPWGSARMGRAHELKGHVTLIRREMAPGKGVDDDCDGVSEATGEFRWQETDLVIPGRGLDFAWTRTYRSRTGPMTTQGAGWDFSYNVSLARQSDGTALLRTGDGRASTFYPSGTNGWFRDEYFMSIGDLDQDGLPDVVTFADGGQWLFQAINGDSGVLRLGKIVDRNGNTLTLGYDPAGRLTTIVDTLDRTNTVDYDKLGQLVSVTDFSGRIVRYEYDRNGDLVACVSPAVTGTPLGNDFPGGKTNRYAYTSGSKDERLNHNLAACIDPQGQTWLQVAYQPTTDPASLDFDAVDNLICGSTTHLRRYPQTPSTKNGFATVKSIVCDPVGNVTESYHDSRQRCLRQLEFTGRADPTQPVTENSNRPGGKLRADDPDYYETQWTWNPDSLCTRELRPGGDSTEVVYQRAQDHNSSRSNKTSRQHAGDARVVRERASSAVDTDGDGEPDTSELAWYFEYDPRFGSPASNLVSRKVHAVHHGSSLNYPLRYLGGTSSGGADTPSIPGIAAKNWLPSNFRLEIGGLPASRNGLAEVRDFSSIVDAPEETEHGFITRVTDPRGIVRTAEYDERGNTIKQQLIANNGGNGIEVRSSSARRNASGQLTAITNPPDASGFRRVDTFDYYTDGPQAGYLRSVVIDDRDLLGLRLTTTFEYDPRGNVTRCVDPRGNDWLYTYNALDQCVRAQSPTNLKARAATDCIYDANDNLVQCAAELLDENDLLVRTVSSLAEYDLLGRCVAVADQISPGVFVTNRFQYDNNGSVVAAYSPRAVSGLDLHSFTQFEYDERGLVFREVGAPGSGNSPTNEHSYSLNGMRVRINQLEGILRVTTLAYDGFNRLSGISDPMGNEVNYLHDRNGNLIRVRRLGETMDVPGSAGNVRLAETRYAYDEWDRCVQKMSSFFDVFTGLPFADGQSTTTFAYAPNDDCVRVTDDNGHSTAFAYDSAGRLASITDSKKNLTSFALDPCGNVIGITQIDHSDLTVAAQEFTVTRGFDKLHRLTRSADNTGNIHSYRYDSLGRRLAEVDPKGVLSVVEYDDLGRKLKLFVDTNADGVIQPGEFRWSNVWDDNSRCVSVTDVNNHTTTGVYDSLDRCLSVTEADGTRSSLVWSPRSNLLSAEDANGTTVTNTYDLCGRIIHRDVAARGAAAATTTFEQFSYDGLSRCVAATNDVSWVSFFFDSLGNCVRSTQDGLSTTSTYDGVGNCTSMTYPGGRVVTCTYDPLNELASVSSSGGGGLPPVALASYSYEGPGRLGRIARANGVNTRIQWDGLLNPPNAPEDFGWLQVSGVSHQTAGGGAIIDRRSLSYDRNQNKIERAQTTPFYAGGATRTNRFGYDPLDRLVNSGLTLGGASGNRTYVLDAKGNRQAVLENGMAQPYVMESTVPPADLQMDQYTSTPFGVQKYDDNGNLTMRSSAIGGLQYVYDYADRLVEVYDVASGAPAPVVGYGYDALGRRISKTAHHPAPLAAVTTQFVHDGDDCDDADPIEEREDGVLRRAFVVPHILETKGGGLSRRTFPQPHVFEQKGRVMFTSAGEILHLHADDLGNTLALTDASGNVVERYDYDDYGQPEFLTSDGAPLAVNTSPAGNPFLFYGMEWEAETALYHQACGNYADPQSGKATSRLNINGNMPNRISMNVTVPKQTQGATFGEKVNAGLHGLADNHPWSVSPGGMKKEEGGRHTPFHNKYRAQLYERFQTGDIPTQEQFKTKPKEYEPKREFTGHVTLIK